MQYVNDDMDEVFRQAAENYPLHTNSADWNKVLAAMGETEGKTTSDKKRNKNGRFLWLLLLLPMGLICNQLYSPVASNNNGVSQLEAGDKESNTIRGNRSKQAESNTVITDEKKSIDQTVPPVESMVEKANSIADGIDLVTTHSKNQDLSYSFNTRRSKGSSKNYDLSSGNAVFATGAKKQDLTNDNFENKEIYFSRSYVSHININELYGQPSNENIKWELKPSLASPEQKPETNITVARRKRFYAGVMGAIDATTVKFQKVEDAGFNYGVLLGYQLNKRLSIETGAFVERKYYYSEGKYFNAYKIYPNLPSNYWIDNISGNCKMIEVPVSLKYNLVSRKNSSFFATAGVSSYFMKKESYGFDYYYGSATSYRHHEMDTANSTKNFFSNLSFSAGYSHRLGNFADLRVEPYLKLPMAGMGIGNLPLFSAGVQVGLTKKF